MPLSEKQLNKIAKYIKAQDEIPYFEEEEEEDIPSWRNDTEGELLLYADNTSEIYPMKQQIIKNMKKKIEKGVYDPEAAVKGWMYWVDAAAKLYGKEFLDPSLPYHQVFTREVRMNVAREVAEREYNDIISGEYDERNASRAKKDNLRMKKIEYSYMIYSSDPSVSSGSEYLYQDVEDEASSVDEMISSVYTALEIEAKQLSSPEWEVGDQLYAMIWYEGGSKKISYIITSEDLK